MHLLLCPGDSQTELCAEVARCLPGARTGALAGDLLECQFGISPGQRLPQLAFLRQLLPNAMPLHAESIRAWAAEIVERLAGVIPDDQPWGLHIEPQYSSPSVHHIGARAWHTLAMRKAAGGTARRSASITKPSAGQTASDALFSGHPRRAPETAGRHRCVLVREAVLNLLSKKRRHLLRQLQPVPGLPPTPDVEPPSPRHTLVQVLLLEPGKGFFSIAPAPLPFEQSHLISPFPKGIIAPAVDKSAPSRAFAKLLEAELRMGIAVERGQTCVDLGASPGSWTYVVANRGAFVLAVDHSPLREDLMAHRQVQFRKLNAFAFQPSQPFDWLLCDVIADPEQTAALLLEWARRRWCRHFIVTIKLRGDSGLAVLDRLKRELPPLTGQLFFKQLCANKKEVCVFGSAS